MLHSSSDDPVEKRLGLLERRAERERSARRQAESLLEQKSLELYQANQQLLDQAAALETTVAERTAALTEALARAEAATRAKSDFLATVSHEIRTPLHGIIGLADTLAFCGLNAEQSEQMELLIRSGQSLQALINDILDFSKIEAGHLELELRDFDPRQELHTVIETFRPSASAKGIELRFEAADLPESVRADSLRIRQILTNLVSNAIKFTERGEVTVSLSMVAGAEGQRLLLVVRDTGVGFAPEFLPFIFEPFRQADGSVTRKFGGTGLGLAICKRLAVAMGGEITAESVPGATTFQVEVRVDPPQGTVDPAEVVPVDELPRLSVLVVDDSDVNRTVAKTMLRKLGQTVHLANGGHQAIEMVEGHDFDLVFMDLQMPEMDGLTTTRKLRAMSAGRQLRIIALTANVSNDERERCLREGMDGFLAKPFRINELRAELQFAVSRERQEFD